MCPEICKKCNRILIYCHFDNAGVSFPFKNFFWCIDKNRLEDCCKDNSYPHIVMYHLDNGEWKKIKPKRYKMNTDVIDEILRRYDFDMVSFPDWDSFHCPCHLEHKISDWNE